MYKRNNQKIKRIELLGIYNVEKRVGKFNSHRTHIDQLKTLSNETYLSK